MSDQAHLQNLIKTYTRRLYKLREQQAWTGRRTDPAVIIEIEDIEAELAALQNKLAALNSESAPASQSESSSETVTSDTRLIDLKSIKTKLDELQTKLATLESKSLPEPQPEVSNEALLPNEVQISLPSTGLKTFILAYTPLLQQLYQGKQRVLVEKEIGGGFGGATVLLVRPIGEHGRKLAAQIVKIGSPSALKREQENYDRYVAESHRFVAADVTSYTEREGLGGIIYNFVGGGRLGQTRTLEEYFQDEKVSAQAIIRMLEDLVDKALGEMWYAEAVPQTCFFDDEYGQHLLEYLRVRVRPMSQDGLWPAGQAPEITAGYLPLKGEAVPAEHLAIQPETLIHIEGLVISKIGPHEIKLQHPTQSGNFIKVEGIAPTGFDLGQAVTVRGEVRYNRLARLAEIVSAAFAGFPETPVDPQTEVLTWADQSYPNPLHLYPKFLDHKLDGKKSLVHGDLHPRNILVDEAGQGWLIDFALVKERHNLYDFIKLETYIRQMVLSHYDFSFSDYLQFEAALLEKDRTVPNIPVLQKAYQVIRRLREMAMRYVKLNFGEEYLPGLFLFSLAVMKYGDNHGAKAARLAFGTAAVVGKSLTEASVPSLTPSPPFISANAELWPPTLPWNDPYYQLPTRNNDLESMVRQFIKKGGQWGIFISGLGGLGKTATAIEIGRRCMKAQAFERVLGDSAKLDFMIDGRMAQAEDRATLDFEGFLNELGTQLDRPDIRTQPIEEKRQILHTLLNRAAYLVVVDNLETTQNADQIVRDLPHLLGRSRAIITSREIVTSTAVPLALEELSEADSLFFLRKDAEMRQCDDIRQAPDKLLREVHQAVGGQPLALKLVVGQAVNFGLDFALNNIQNTRGDFYRFLYWDSWQKLSLLAQEILIHIGGSPASVPLTELMYGPFDFDTEDDLAIALEELINFSLINVIQVTGGRRYAIHEITRRFINSDLPDLWHQLNDVE